MRLPGIVYSLVLAVGAWAVQYFTEGPGSGVPWAPILVAAVPIILQSISVAATPGPQAPVQTSSARSLSPEGETVIIEAESKTRTQKLLWG